MFTELRKPLVLFISGFVLAALAACLKIMHIAHVDALMMAALATQLAAIVYAGFILLKQKH